MNRVTKNSRQNLVLLPAGFHLDPRESTILRYRFGLDGGTEKTLEEVGEKFNVTRERVRQIQNLALRKLRKMIEKLEKNKNLEQ